MSLKAVYLLGKMLHSECDVLHDSEFEICFLVAVRIAVHGGFHVPSVLMKK